MDRRAVPALRPTRDRRDGGAMCVVIVDESRMGTMSAITEAIANEIREARPSVTIECAGGHAHPMSGAMCGSLQHRGRVTDGC